MRRYDVFMAVGCTGFPSLFTRRNGSGLRDRDGVLKVGASCRPKTSSLRDSRSAPLPFAEPFRILSVAVSSRFKLNLIYLILLSVGFGFIRYLQIQSTWT